MDDDQDVEDNYDDDLFGLVADIRAAVGDPEGKLMQDELIEHCKMIYAAYGECLIWRDKNKTWHQSTK